MKTKNEIPLFECVIDDDIFSEKEVNVVSLVEKPAIQRNFHVFNEEKSHKFEINNERRIITGPLMIPNLPIFRMDELTGPYYVTFSEQTIEKICMKFMKKGFGMNVNTNHKTPIDGVFMFESWLIDGNRGINAPSSMNDLANGTWMASYKIENDDVWENEVKTGNIRGFSVEGKFDELFVMSQHNFSEKQNSKMDLIDEIINLLN